MKNKFLKISIFSLFLIIIIGLQNVVQANSIKSITMDIYIDKNGNAEVTEIWDCYTNQGTESYHPYYNLGTSQITNLRVYDQNKSYQSLSSWNTSGTLSSKAYKCGINKISNGVELCWGISNYGSNVYTVKYNISNFVAQLTDNQMIYWTLIPYDFSNTIGSVKIKIYSDTYFQDTIDVWGYGNYGGYCYVNDGAIYMQSKGTLKKSEYMTILVKLPNEFFATNNYLPMDFNYYLDMSKEDSIKYRNNFSIFTFMITFIIISLVAIGIPFLLAYVIHNKLFMKNKKYGFKYGQMHKKIPKNIEYYRDIPCNGDVFRIFYIAYQYGLVKKETDVLGAIVLKWLKSFIIRIENKEGGTIFKREETVIILNKDTIKAMKNWREKELYKMLYEASKDGILENKEFEDWCKRSYKRILGWFDDILREERMYLVSEKFLTIKEGFFRKKYIATKELKDMAIKISGLKKYLLDYSLIPEREAIEVTLFQDYLIFAQIMGIAKKVAKQFRELYPDIIEQTNYGSYDNLIYVNFTSSRGISKASSAKTSEDFARALASSYSSGGGGFSSGGGGGGSFGGGGGRRRFPLKEDRRFLMNFIKEPNRIYLTDEKGKTVAEITFEEIEKGIYNIDHTFVDESLRGQGVASKLVEEAVKLIEEKGTKVQATCTYASKWLEEHKI